MSLKQCMPSKESKQSAGIFAERSLPQNTDLCKWPPITCPCIIGFDVALTFNESMVQNTSLRSVRTHRHAHIPGTRSVESGSDVRGVIPGACRRDRHVNESSLRTHILTPFRRQHVHHLCKPNTLRIAGYYWFEYSFTRSFIHLRQRAELNRCYGVARPLPRTHAEHAFNTRSKGSAAWATTAIFPRSRTGIDHGRGR